MNKTLKTILALVLALLFGVFLVLEAVLILPPQFDELYLGALSDKYQRLRTVYGSKIVVIGGSSVAFGVDSQTMEDYIGMPVVNFGLYGPLGTTIMMDLTRGSIGEGDIVVLAPETDEQTMSMYFNGEGMWECCDSDFTMLFRIPGSKWGEMLGSFWTYAAKKLNFYRYGKPLPNGVYSHRSFDLRGDIIYSREQVDMDDWYDSEVLIDLDTDIIEQEFIDYVNDYVAYCESKGATVYWSYPPMNILSVQQTYQQRLEYATFLRENLDCEIISNLDDYILYPGYFYDTNYHVNDRGVTVHTAHLIQDIMNVLGDPSPVDVRMAPPLMRPNGTSLEPTGEPSDEMAAETETAETEETEAAVEETPAVPEKTGSSRDAQFFLTEPGDGGLRTTGLTDAGKQQTELEVPWMIDGVLVTEIGTNTFSGAQKLTTIRIQENITRILNNAFDGAQALTGIYVDNQGQNVLIPGKDLFANVTPHAKVYVSKANYGSFIADYFWGNYLDRIEKAD